MSKNKNISKIFVYLMLFSLMVYPFTVYSITENIENNSNEQEITSNENEEDITSNNNGEETQNVEKKADISYTTHIQNIGWQKYVKNGEMAGTTGKSLRLEGIRIKLENQEYEGNVEYRTHIQNIGWETGFKKNDEMSGTSGRSLRLEAIEIKLTGTIAEHYDIYYRVHAQDLGWLGWARNGEQSGTAGYSYRLEGIEIKLVEKGTRVPEYGEAYTFADKSKGTTTPIGDDKLVSYTTHVQNIGWQKYVTDGKMAGTSGKSLRLEGIKIKLINQQYTGDIEYKTLIQDIGWQETVKNDALSGTSGRSLRLEAIKINLTGEMAEHYDVYYRVHAENYGWLDWAKNGEKAGTSGYGYRLEAIEIKIVDKNETGPTNISRPYVNRQIRYSGYYDGSWQNYNYDGSIIGNSNNLQAYKIDILDKEYSGNISYATYVTNYGWTEYVTNNAISNNTNNRIEALKIKIDGDISNHYDIYYSAYISKIGWTDWAKNDEQCGNIGFGNNIQKIKIKLIEKNKPAPGDTTNIYQEEELKIKYSSYVEGSNWQDYVSNGTTSGTTGQSKPIQGIKIHVNKKIYKGSIEYSTHVANIGWQNYFTDDAQAGKIGNNIEAIKIRLTGELAEHYDIFYRVHAAEVGWMGWTSNDNPAGTVTASLGIEAIEIKILDKGSPTPENSDNINTTEPYLSARWVYDSNGNRYYYNIYGEMLKGRGFKVGKETYYFGPSGIFLGTKNLEVLDISAHNGVVDWKAVAESGVYGVILRVAASSIYRDSRLPENVAGCKKYGIPYGIYIYSYAENYTEGAEYAQFTKSLMNEFNMNPTLGIFLDLESNSITQYMNTTHYTAVVNGFLSVIPNAELYTYLNYADTALNTQYMRSKITWIAHYNTVCRYTGSYRMWQYTSTGRNAGVNGDVDRSVLYN